MNNNKLEEEKMSNYNPNNIFRKKTKVYGEEKEIVALDKIKKDSLMKKIIGFFHKLLKK